MRPTAEARTVPPLSNRPPVRAYQVLIRTLRATTRLGLPPTNARSSQTPPPTRGPPSRRTRAPLQLPPHRPDAASRVCVLPDLPLIPRCYLSSRRKRRQTCGAVSPSHRTQGPSVATIRSCTHLMPFGGCGRQCAAFARARRAAGERGSERARPDRPPHTPRANPNAAPCTLTLTPAPRHPASSSISPSCIDLRPASCSSPPLRDLRRPASCSPSTRCNVLKPAGCSVCRSGDPAETSQLLQQGRVSSPSPS